MTSTLKALIDLPDVFDIDEMQKKTRQSRHAARMMLSRAHAAELVAPAGPRSGIYYNLVKSKNRTLEAAVKIGIPSAIIIGPSALHWHSATSQRSHFLTVAWLKNRKMRSVAMIDDVIAVARTPEWYEAIAGHVTEGPGGLPVLDADYAIADMNLQGGEGDVPVLDEDDLDLDDAGLDEDDITEIEEVLKSYGIEDRREEEKSAPKPR